MANKLQILGSIVNVAVDDTLTVKGASADAKVTGDAINSINNLVGDTPVAEQISQAIQENKTDLTGYATETYVNDAIAQSASDVSAANEQYVDAKISSLVDTAPDALNTLNELAQALGDDPNFATTIMTQIGSKVDKVEGKGLSTNDYTTAEKDKLANIADGANLTIVDSVFSDTSTNPVQNKVVNEAISNLNTLVGTTPVSAQIESAIADKAGKEHNHKISEITDIGDANVNFAASAGSVVWSNVTGKPNAYTPSAHSHETSDVTNLQDVLESKANVGHTHDDRYYTENEIDTKLSDKADISHNHDSDYDTKGSAADVQANLDVVSDKLDSHTGDTNIHVTTSDKTNWNTAYTHSQSDHARVDATKVADSTTNGNILINGAETNVYTHPNSGVTAGTYKSVTVNAHGHVTGGTNPTTLAGYGITDAEAKGAANSALTSAKEYTDSVASGKSDTSHNHDSAYDTKGAADTALGSAKAYADTVANAVKNDLLNGAGAAYDTLKELGDLIVGNQDAIDALEEVATGKADKTHSHAISDVTNLQTALDGKAASSHGTHVSYSTTAPKMDGTASAGSASTVARTDHVHPTDTSRAAQTDLDSHTGNTTVHITSTERTNWNAATTTLDTHVNNKENPHNVTIDQIGAAPTGYGLGGTDSTIVLLEELNSFKVCGWKRVAVEDSPIEVSGLKFYWGVVRCDVEAGWTATQTFYTTDGYKLQRFGNLLDEYWGEWEWIDPPMSEGVEYRTTDLLDSQSVYKKIQDGMAMYRTTATNDTGYRSYDSLIVGTGNAILHTGNKPTGSYAGNGSSATRTIDTGGIGNMLLVCGGGTGYAALVFPEGCIYKENITVGASVSNVANFKDGVLTLTTAVTNFNAYNNTYTYYVL